MSFERIELPRLRELIDRRTTLIEVLPPAEYAEEHLPGAINIPLKTLGAEAVSDLDRCDPVVVYCWDAL